MKIKYDKTADALYISLTKEKVAKSFKMTDKVIVDVDKKGRTIGIEILEASSQLPKQKASKITLNIPAFA